MITPDIAIDAANHYVRAYDDFLDIGYDLGATTCALAHMACLAALWSATDGPFHAEARVRNRPPSDPME